MLVKLSSKEELLETAMVSRNSRNGQEETVHDGSCDRTAFFFFVALSPVKQEVELYGCFISIEHLLGMCK